MAIQTYGKNMSEQLSENFKSYEFDCNGQGCCSETKIDTKLVEILQKIRNHFNKPVTINSAYRCLTHNRKIGSGDKSQHRYGCAADIVVEGTAPAEVAKYAESIGVKGIGLYEGNDGNFVHVDTRTYKAFWYGHAEVYRSTFRGNVKVETPVSQKPGQVSCNSEEYAKKIWDYLYEKIKNPYGVAGLMGNLYAESGLCSNNLENYYETKLGYNDNSYTAAIDNGTYGNFVKDSAGYGLAQWTYHTRKKGLLDLAKKKNKSIGDYEVQLEFLWNELNKDYKGVLKVLQQTSSLVEATDKVLSDFENPADQSTAVKNRRLEFAEKYYTTFAKKEQTTSDAKVEEKVEKNPTNKNKFATALTAVNVRRAPNVKADIFGTVYSGQEVEILEVTKDNWYKIKWSKSPYGYGYTSNTTGTYYRILDENSVYYAVKITASALNVREKPSLAARRIRTLGRNTIHNIVEVQGEWGRLSSGGWINLNYTVKTN